jgi:site-specific recombinase
MAGLSRAAAPIMVVNKPWRRAPRLIEIGIVILLISFSEKFFLWLFPRVSREKESCQAMTIVLLDDTNRLLALFLPQSRSPMIPLISFCDT